MKAFRIAIKEMGFRWRSSLLMILIVFSITGVVSFFWVNSSGFTKEIKRNTRDIGSNVVILPVGVDQVAYHNDGGFSEKTMPYQVVNQLIEFKASLNHLIPMLESRQEVRFGSKVQTTRVVGIAASIPMPGRPKAPMQKAVPPNSVQVGSALAKGLEIGNSEEPNITLNNQQVPVSRINKPTGTWQDSALFMDLESAQKLFSKPDQISRIEAIECTSEKCEELGVSSAVVLKNELANITDQAQIFRRESMADARVNLRNMSAENLDLLTNVMWIFLVAATTFLAGWNSAQRRSEIGVFRAIGFRKSRVLGILLWRNILLSLVGALLGILFGTLLSAWQVNEIFEVTGKKMSIDFLGLLWIGTIAVVLSGLASLIPASLSASRQPADIIGKDAA